MVNIYQLFQRDRLDHIDLLLPLCSKLLMISVCRQEELDHSEILKIFSKLRQHL